MSSLLRKTLSVFLALSLMLGSTLAASAQQIGIIRDAEIEAMLRAYAAPLLRAAGIERAPQITVVNDRRFNAFVTEESRIFINYGTILESPTPSALKSVIAHEIGHLAGGHVARLREQMEIAGRVQAVSMLLGIGAMAAASGSSNSGEVGQMASAFILASQSAGLNSLMAYRQTEESAADAAALRLLNQTGQSGRGLVETLRILHDNQVARAGASPYLSSHPLAMDRINQVEAGARASQFWGASDSANDVRMLAMAKAKLVGFLEPGNVANRYPNSDSSLAARYARTIAAYKSGGGASALQFMPSLVAENGSNPYMHELYGQMLYELGQPAQAIAPLRRAVELAPEEVQIRILYGQALIGAGGVANFDEAVLQLRRSAVSEPSNVRVHTLMSQAYAGLGRMGDATLAAAEAALARQDRGTAFGLARQATQQLPQGTPGWLRANDILAMNR